MSLSLVRSHPKQQFWKRSYFNLMTRELCQWLPNRRKFWFSGLTWTLLTAIVSALWLTSDQDIAPAPYSPTVAGWLFIASMRGVLSLQSIVSEEKLTGTLAWILSKPVPRSTFYLAKLSAQMLVACMISVLIQGFFLFPRFPAVNSIGFILVMVYLTLIVWFYQSLTTMLDVITTNKTARLGVPIALILMGNIFTLIDSTTEIDLITILGYTLPWGMNAPLVKNSIAEVLITGQPLATIAPVIATALWIPIFCAIGIRHLNRQEL